VNCSCVYWAHKAKVQYRRICSGHELFCSDTTSDASPGRARVWDGARPGAIISLDDRRNGKRRTDIKCTNGDAHLLHMFPDRSRLTDLRVGVKSASLAVEENPV
jgi:peptide-methionine (R)-S-oxide reductase